MILAANWSLAWWLWLIILVAVLLVGFIVGVIISRSLTTKYLKENPPITEKMIRMMYRQMGRTPSEKQVHQIMKSLNQQNK